MLLLIPGPVTTDPRVRAAAAQDFAPWDLEFRELLARVRTRICAAAGGRPGEHVALTLPGSGHFAIEAAVRTFVPPGGKILLPRTGQYADRVARLAGEAGRSIVSLPVAENQPASPEAVEAALMADPSISHLAVVYSETATGILHDAPALAAAAGRAGRRVLIDAVSAFGAAPLDVSTMPMLDCVVFTPNKCLESLPGLSFGVAPVGRLLECRGQAGSWSLDYADLYAHDLKSGPGSHRFTPSPQAIAALDVALDLFEAEGQAARLARYTANMRVFHDGAAQLGLTPCLGLAEQGPIVVNLQTPARDWSLQAFVDRLKTRGVVISNFYNTPEPSLRIGCIGAITPADCRTALDAMAASLDELGFMSRKAA